MAAAISESVNPAKPVSRIFFSLSIVAIASLLIAGAGHASAAGLTGDINGDGSVGAADMTLLVSNWGKTTAADDLNGNGKVDIYDLSILLSNWGKTSTGGGGGGTTGAMLNGVYEGSDNPDGVDWFGQTFLGKPTADLALDFEASDTWANISGPGWLLNGWADSNYQKKLVLSVPMLTTSGTSLAAGAGGSYNSNYQTLAQNLVDDGLDSTIIRLGWEFNGGWYTWSAAGKASSFISYWQQIVNTMRAVPGQHFKFVWNPSNGLQSLNDATTAYPGDSYVDYIGDDVYNESWVSNYTNAAARWADLNNDTNGVAFWVAFAASHNKPIAFPEWGTGDRSDGHGGGDDPTFIQNMYDVMKGTNTGFNDYWDYCASDYCSDFDDNPKSAALYKQLFGQ